MKPFRWNPKKSEWLLKRRGVSFQDIVEVLSEDGLLDVIRHPNQARHKDQKIFVVNFRGYVWLVPFVETEKEILLKTIIPSRKYRKKYGGAQ